MWITHRYAIIISTFIAYTEVNTFLCPKYFLKKEGKIKVLDEYCLIVSYTVSTYE